MFQFLFIFLLLHSITSFAQSCDEALEWQNPTVAEMVLIYKTLMREKADHYFIQSEEEIKRFRREGWVELSRIAKENDTSVADILTYYYERRTFVIEAMTGNATHAEALIKSYKMSLANIKKAADTLEKLKPEDKLKRRHWEALHRVYEMLIELGDLQTGIDIKNKSPNDRVTVNNLEHFTPTQIRNLFDGLEDITEETVLDIAFNTFGKPEIKKPQPLVEPVLPFAVAVPFQKPVITFSKPTDLLNTNTSVTMDLSLLLKDKLPLEPNKAYSAITKRNQTLSIYIDKRITDEDQGPEKQVIRRLLKGIISANDRSGIKILADLGPHIIELKAVLHGHKRIIGCLDGKKLTLKYLIDIKDSKATYFRRIDSRLCL